MWRRPGGGATLGVCSALREDDYLELVARTAADEHAVIEISGLTDQAAAAAQAVRESMRQVSLAAAALALPEPAAAPR
jgi:hypothetical protein